MAAVAHVVAAEWVRAGLQGFGHDPRRWLNDDGFEHSIDELGGIGIPLIVTLPGDGGGAAVSKDITICAIHGRRLIARVVFVVVLLLLCGAAKLGAHP